ncbi:MAG: DUF4230 domain-containing protein [Prevotella sp.]|nr:DUF4230 domain-containing protein [Prevotella sp.]MCI7341765.1 DUF4230 domain-containing protein [Prevotella sp.]MCI7360236.1 DUF4230 domain-containing protein [Prevotella sp.]MDD6590534.1 DUF4230 domain-containing protein [Prevotella sp.]MDD6753810.1 DUF4230 domain-containing protein [Prevotella sp.]
MKTCIKKKILSLFSLMFGNYRLILPILICVAVIIGVIAWLNRNNTIGIQTSDQGITISKAQIESVRNIGEWEFLSVSDEELVDTTRTGFFGDDHLVRIYFGTLRLGIDMRDTREGWLSADNDTVVAILPAIKLLDENFIDETRTRSFFEVGKWSPADHEALYKKAYTKMRQRCVTPANIRSAERNAADQIDNLLRSMGFENVKVRFDDTQTQDQ